jgi:hypothetical protein
MVNSMAQLLYRGKDPVPLYRRLAGTPGWCGQVEKILLPPGFDPQTVFTPE